MSPHPDLEDRLRTGLRAAAQDLPSWDVSGAIAGDGELAPTARPAIGASRQAPRGRHRRWGTAGLAMLAAAATVAAVVAFAGDDRPSAEVEVTPPGGVIPAGDPPAGAMVVTDDGVIRTFGPAGEPTGAVATDVFLGMSSVVSDREGGWVACGLPDLGTQFRPDGGGGTVTVPRVGEDRIYRFPREGAPVDLGPGMRFFDLLGTEVAGRNVVINPVNGGGLQMIDIATGERTDVALGEPRYPYGKWAAGGGRFAVWVGGRFRLWDLATARKLPDAPVTLPSLVWHVTLAPDATTLAYATGEQESGRLDVVVVDVATGAELFRRRMPLEITTSQLAFDGHAVAVNDGVDTAGNRPAGGVTHVIDIATGDERTVDAVGLLP